MQNGRFICLEGGDGVGKTTQIQLLFDFLSAQGVDVIPFSKLNQTSNFRAKTKECTQKYMTEAESCEITKDHLRMGIGIIQTREPGGCEEAEAIRSLIFTRKFCPKAQLMLMMAARAAHIEQIIKPALIAGKTVLCDRFIYSSVVYQGIAGGLGADYVINLHEQAFGKFYPDITIVLKLNHDEAEKRLYERSAQQNHFDQEDINFKLAIHDGFAGLHYSNIIHVDASGSIDVVHTNIIKKLNY